MPSGDLESLRCQKAETLTTQPRQPMAFVKDYQNEKVKNSEEVGKREGERGDGEGAGLVSWHWILNEGGINVCVGELGGGEESECCWAVGLSAAGCSLYSLGILPSSKIHIPHPWAGLKIRSQMLIL